MHTLRRRLLSLSLWPCALATSLPTPAQDTPLGAPGDDDSGTDSGSAC